MDDIIKDEVLGELKYQKFAWVKRMDTPYLNSKGNLVLGIQDPNKEGILDVQREAYKTYLQNEEKYKNCVTDLLLDYYKWNYEVIVRTVSGLPESCHKDVITDKELYNGAVALWYLFICRDGSFGYGFGCCWDKENGLAVLLSESEPQVISRTQLENLHKLNDPTVGLLVHDGKNAWKGLEVNKFFGKPENLEIELEGGVDEGITEAQQKAYADYLEKKDEHFKALTKLMLTAYLGDPALAEKSLHSDFKVVVASALPKTLFIDREGNYGWICYTSWNDSYLAILLSCETPCLMYPNDLRSYSSANKIYDKVFGAMFREFSTWRKVDVCRINQEICTCDVTVETYENDVTEEQRAVYLDYKANQTDYWKLLKANLLEYYKKNYNDIKKYVNIPESMSKKNVNIDTVINLLSFDRLLINTDGRLAWTCESPIEENGMAFEWADGKVKLIVPMSDFIYG